MIADWLHWLAVEDWRAFALTAASSFMLIAAAEMGDKSQLVCMTLAARYRAGPVLFGAICAFLLLNSLAVLFGAAVAHWLPQYLVSAAVAILFALFGSAALRQPESDEDEPQLAVSGRGLFWRTWLLISVAEFGDKTQLAVVAYSSTANVGAVWLGACLALSGTSALGVWAGRTVLQRLPLHWLHRFSGALFLMLAVLAGYDSYRQWPEGLVGWVR
jgi:Ca2+/H+ antiporter, TMEM165/GDT1 family